MDLHARWDKILHDIWSNKARSLLVIFTIAIGIAAVGMINNTVRMMKRDLFGQFAERNPASIVLYISPFQEELAKSVTSLREVRLAQAQRTASGSLDIGNDKWASLDLLIFPNFEDMQIDPSESSSPPAGINQVKLDQGLHSPGLRGIWLERNTAAALGIQVGDLVTVKMHNENYRMSFTAIVHDMTREPYSITGDALGYISMPTLEWLGEPAYYNQLKISVAQDATDREHVLQVAGLARDRVIEPAGLRVLTMQIPGSSGTPGDFWAKKQVNGILLVFQLMSILAILLSAGLVVNTISAVIVQQIKQIGIMRSVGAVRTQIVQMYLLYVLALSAVGVLIALPLGLLGSWGLTSVAAKFMNFTISRVDLPPGILLLQIGLGLGMPVGVALFPILQGTRISVYEAIYQYSLGGKGERGWLETQMSRIRHISPPVMLSLRNTFRNKARLAFTLVTLTVAGAMFMAVFSSYATLQQEIRDFGRYIAFDASISIPGGANRHTVEREAKRIPGIQVAEGWASTNGFIVHSDGSESDRIEIVGIPPDPQTIQPLMVAGRWLEAQDDQPIVINEDLLVKEPELKVGDSLTLKVNGLKHSFQIVGIASKHMMGPRIYVNYNQFAHLTGRYNQVDSVRVLATPGAFSSAKGQTALGKELEKRFTDAQLSTSASSTRDGIFSSLSQAFTILLVILLLVAAILAIIGGLGLTGAMGLNVLERVREIGVLRAVGASHTSVRQVVVVEGISVAILSWLLSALLSYPVGMALASAIVQTTFGTAATFRYSLPGLFAWLAAVILIGIASSLVPARDAARLTVREVLNYE
jgi:putative ABC transport system permease protein